MDPRPSATRDDDAALLAWLARRRAWEPSPEQPPWDAWDWAILGVVAGMLAGACWMAWTMVV
jgi:hypothetical protein